MRGDFLIGGMDQNYPRHTSISRFFISFLFQICNMKCCQYYIGFFGSFRKKVPKYCEILNFPTKNSRKIPVVDSFGAIWSNCICFQITLNHTILHSWTMTWWSTVNIDCCPKLGQKALLLVLVNLFSSSLKYWGHVDKTKICYCIFDNVKHTYKRAFDM